MIKFFAATTENSIYKVNRGYQDGSADKVPQTVTHANAHTCMAHVHPPHTHHTHAIINNKQHKLAEGPGEAEERHTAVMTVTGLEF